MTAPAIPEFIAGLRRGETAASHFTIIANAALRDPRLSWAAKGLFANLMTHREGMVITEEFLARQSPEGVKAVRRLLGELRDRGYVYRGGRSRYPKGTVNKAGRDISGALGPYAWFVTDKPDEIAVILSRYAEEQRAANVENAAEGAEHKRAGQDNLPNGPVVPTSANATVDNSALPPKRAGSDDQAKQGVCAGRDYRPEPTGGLGRSLEDHREKTTTDEDPGGTLPPDPLRTPTPPAPGTGRVTSPSVVGSQGGLDRGDHKWGYVGFDVMSAELSGLMIDRE